MNKKIQSILSKVLSEIEPKREDLDGIRNSLNEFKEKIKKQIKKNKLDVDVFEGGSFAKKTIIKKDAYDVDIFIRFDEKYKKENISKLTEKLLKAFENNKNLSLIHGSRDYFRIKKSLNFFIEVVPVLKVNPSKPEKAENVTDLSYSHVKYINKKIKSQKILNEIKTTKAFCYSTNTYGAESYINGFSGYAIELLIYYYKSFLNFIREISKHKPSDGKIVIDIEKNYKNKNEVLLDVNTSKLGSPIILIDPTYKQRNTLAALSEETFEKFQQACRKFLKNPSIEHFRIKKIDLEKIEKNALSKGHGFILLEAKTTKQEGDIAGSKLMKFYRHIEQELLRFFEIKNKGFDYNQKKSAKMFFVVQPKKGLIVNGPFLEDKKNLKKFKKLHKNIFSKSGKIYAKEKIIFTINEFIKNWKTKYRKKIKDMGISDFKII